MGKILDLSHLKLIKIFIFTEKISKATFTAFIDFATFKAGTTTLKYRACVMGSIDNKNTKPKGLMCTDVNPISKMECETTTDGSMVMMPDEAICLVWTNKENNLCMGDYGGKLFTCKKILKNFNFQLFFPIYFSLGPIWAYDVDMKGKQTSSQLFCIAVTSPNARAGGSCQDAHKVICEFTPGKVKEWVTNVIARR